MSRDSTSQNWRFGETAPTSQIDAVSSQFYLFWRSRERDDGPAQLYLGPGHLSAPPSSSSIRTATMRPCGRPAAPMTCLRVADIEGALVWHRILAAIEELRRGRREGEPVN